MFSAFQIDAEGQQIRVLPPRDLSTLESKPQWRQMKQNVVSSSASFKLKEAKRGFEV